MPMSEAAKEARRAYQRNWKRAHPEKCREYAERYWNRRGKEESCRRQKEDESGQMRLW